MQIVMIKNEAETLDGQVLPRWRYYTFFRVLEEHDDFVMIVDNNMKAYEFSKDNIERHI